MADELFWVAAGSWAISFLAICAYWAGRMGAVLQMGACDGAHGTREAPSDPRHVPFLHALLRDMVVAAVVSLIPACVGFVLAFVLEGVWG